MTDNSIIYTGPYMKIPYKKEYHVIDMRNSDCGVEQELVDTYKKLGIPDDVSGLDWLTNE